MRSKLSRKNLTLALTMAVILTVLTVAGSTLASETVVFGDFSWDSVQVHNRVAGYILEHGYGYEVDYKFGESIPIFLGLRRGDVDVTTEIWVDNIYDAVKTGLDRGEVISLGSNYPDSPQGWYVPTYVIEGDADRGIEAVAPDLRSVHDLPDYWELFKDPSDPRKGRFHNAPTGWVAHDINNAKVEAYGLTDTFNSFNTGSDAGLNSAIMRAYDRGEPIVVYNWEPNWVIGMLDMTLLEEPAFNEDQWREDFGTAYPATKVHVFINSGLAEKAPRAVSLLANYNTTLAHTNEVLAYMREEDASVEEAAIWFLDNYRDVWFTWIIEDDVRSSVEEALDEELAS